MSNPNENCLEGLRCPNCGSYGPFFIDIVTIALVGDDGVLDMPNDKHWDNGSWCCCRECEHTATVEKFIERSALIHLAEAAE